MSTHIYTYRTTIQEKKSICKVCKINFSRFSILLSFFCVFPQQLITMRMFLLESLFVNDFLQRF